MKWKVDILWFDDMYNYVYTYGYILVLTIEKIIYIFSSLFILDLRGPYYY